MSIVYSRTFRLDGRRFLIPGIDLLNHHPTAHQAEWRLDDAAGCVHLVATAAITAGNKTHRVRRLLVCHPPLRVHKRWEQVLSRRANQMHSACASCVGWRLTSPRRPMQQAPPSLAPDSPLLSSQRFPYLSCDLVPGGNTCSTDAACLCLQASRCMPPTAREATMTSSFSTVRCVLRSAPALINKEHSFVWQCACTALLGWLAAWPPSGSAQERPPRMAGPCQQSKKNNNG